ncbi:MAG TPA: hypothetical protein VF912_17850 [Anaeromyxobacter sp.]
MGIRRIVPFFALALAAGCAHAPRREIAAPAAALRCEEAGVLLARRARTQPLDELRLVLTAPLAYAAAGAGWITDGALVVTVAGGGGLLVCAPLAMLEGATHGDGELTGSCFASVAGAVLGAGPPGVGRGVYRATRRWRCPDHVQLAREVRAVASCHATRGAPGDTEAARVQLVQLRSDRGIWECLPAEERREVEDALAALGAPP